MTSDPRRFSSRSGGRPCRPVRGATRPPGRELLPSGPLHRRRRQPVHRFKPRPFDL